MSSDPQTLSLWPIGTLAAWLTCLAVGVLGLALHYPAVRALVETEDFPPTQIVDAQLTPEAAPPPEPVPLPPPPDQTPPAAAPPVPAPALPPMPATPPLAAVAPPSPAIAFALPTEGLTRIVDAGEAGYTRSVLPAPASSGGGRGPPAAAPAPPPPPLVAGPPAPMHLSLGEGEGRRIMPQYPRDAILAQQEGTVGIRFTVEEDGHVSAVQVTAPSRWPLLNQEAARAVRATLFSPGPKRIYDVPIDFHLNH